MKLSEFEEQDKYCKENNIPGGLGCDNCPATDKAHCADALRNLCDKWYASRRLPDKERKVLCKQYSDEFERLYGLSQWNLLALSQGILEFPS